jgi:nucleoside 2-deoxyribosyltransferase
VKLLLLNLPGSLVGRELRPPLDGKVPRTSAAVYVYSMTREANMTRKFKAYLAGPDVFLPDAIAIGQRKKQLCAKYGFEGLHPFDNEVPTNTAEARIDALIYEANVAMIQEADFGIFNLTPFRGPSADVGTVFELGMFKGLEKPRFGYTNEADDLLTRIKRSSSVKFDSSRGAWVDGNAMTIENFGNNDNLMIDLAISEQGYPVFRNVVRPDQRFYDLTGFESCLRMAAETLGSALKYV